VAGGQWISASRFSLTYVIYRPLATGHWPLLTKIYIDTVEKFWDFLLATLKNVRN